MQPLRHPAATCNTQIFCCQWTTLCTSFVHSAATFWMNTEVGGEKERKMRIFSFITIMHSLMGHALFVIFYIKRAWKLYDISLEMRFVTLCLLTLPELKKVLKGRWFPSRKTLTTAKDVELKIPTKNGWYMCNSLQDGYFKKQHDDIDN